MDEFKGKRVLVVGLAKTGVATAQFLLERGADVLVTDMQGEAKLKDSVDALRRWAADAGKMLALELGGHKMESFKNADLIVASPGVPLAIEPIQQAIRSGVEVISELELAFRYLKGRVIGITGSNGKTTTTTLVGEILKLGHRKCHVAGNIGYPLISFVGASTLDDLYVTEISSFQLEGIKQFKPYIGAVLNITPNHLDRYRSFDEYVAAKRLLFKNYGTEEYAVLNADNVLTEKMAADLSCRVLFFSRKKALARGVFVQGDDVLYRYNGTEVKLIELGDIPLKGTHNQENVMAALAIGRICDVPERVMQQAVRAFKGVEHRLEFVAEIQGVPYYNDSKATSVDATIKAVEVFDGNVLLILGGKDKGGDFSLLRDVLRSRVKHVLLIGAATEKIAQALQDLVPMTRCSSMSNVVETATRLAVPGDTVLLAPACASFDMFDNYEHRGRVFKQEVLKHKDEG
jgi:UDP-N-acetylmuramoylalanine--D-glutamate ligase